MLRVGIVGCGKIADGHVEQVRATGRAEVVAVCDREPLMVEQLAVRMGIPGRHGDFAQMLRSERLDVVHVATPPESHVALACAALDAGCHAFVEKPFALNAADAQRIVDAARRADRRVSVNYLYSFESAALELDRRLDAGLLGEPVHVDTSYGYNLGGDYGLAVMSDPSHWVHRLPGKLFHNVLDHVLAKVARFVDDADAADVRALAFRRRPASGNAAVDAMADELRFTLRSGGVTVSGVVSAHARPVAHMLRVAGTRDGYELDCAARTLVRCAQQTQPSAIGRLFPAWVQAGRFMRSGLRNLGEFRRAEFHYFHGMRNLLNRFYDAVEGRGTDPIPPERILTVCRLIDRLVVAMERPA